MRLWKGNGERFKESLPLQTTKLKKNAMTELECVSSDKKEMQLVETCQIF